MDLRIAVLVGVAASAGWVARGVSSGSPAAPGAEAAPAPAAAPRVVYVAAPARQEVAPPDTEEEPAEEGEDVGALLARVQREAPPPPQLPHNVITGIVADQSSGDRLAGVTVIATGPLIQGAQTVITNESGEFSLADLPAGSYTVMFYYADVTVERSGVTVSSFGHTTLNTQLETGSYIRNIPVPARTFESTLGDAAGSQGDTYGVSFSGTTSLDNTYVVDGIDVTGLQ